MKTDDLIRKYYRLLNEQEPLPPAEDVSGQVPPQDQQQAQPEQPPEAPPQELPSNKVDNNEKHVIKILTNAFIFNPSLFDTNKQTYIKNKINLLSKSVNVPVAKTVDEIKRIISLDNSLRIESRTLAIINKYMTIFEQQKLDATDMNADVQQDPQQGGQKEAPRESNANKLNLTEIFPLYKELILKALRHIPTNEELMIIKPVVNEFADVDPEKIVVTIQGLLNQSSEDSEVENILSNA